MTKKGTVTIRVDEELHDYLKKMADREARPLSNMIYRLLSKAVVQDKLLVSKRATRR